MVYYVLGALEDKKKLLILVMKMNEELLLKNEEFESCIVNLIEMIKRTKLNDVVVKKVFSVMQKLRIKKRKQICK